MEKTKEETNWPFWLSTSLCVMLFLLPALFFIAENESGFIILTIIGLVLLYFIPSFIVGIRKHRSGMAIVALNILLGWTFLGWAGALVWSLTGNVEEKKR